jgi:hypothetical protein
VSSRPRTRRRRRRLAGVAVAAILLAGTGVLVAANIEQLAFAGEPSRDWVSGAAMPDGDLPGWRQIFVDDFNRDELGDKWGTYSGTPGGDPYSHWEPSHVEVRDSLLVLRGYQEDGRWVTGGVSNFPVTQTYGKWEVRVRVDQSDVTTYHLLLWPNSGEWPPEIDFLEDWGGDRSQASAFLHWKTPGGKDKVQRTVKADFSTWQTVGVEWLPGEVKYTLNGEVWGSVSGPEVPSVPMWMALQAQAGGCEKKVDAGSTTPCPNVGEPENADVEIDWVVVYEPTG